MFALFEIGYGMVICFENSIGFSDVFEEHFSVTMILKRGVTEIIVVHVFYVHISTGSTTLELIES